MYFLRFGSRDRRRRRVLWQDQWGAASLGRASLGLSARDLSPPRSANYGDAEFMDDQPRLTDLVPMRLGIYAVILLAGLATIAGLEGLYAWMPQMASLTTDGRVATFDLDGEGSLAVWLSSMTLALAGLLALLVFAVRRHRRDDYQGRYRVWLWAAFCWFLMSLDETASLHEGFKEAMSHMTGARILGDGSIWWVTCYFFLLGAVGTRLMLDMRECLLSSTLMLLTALCFALAVVTQLGWVLPDSGARGVMIEEGTEMVGDLLLLLAMGLHARHVILDAEGLLSRRRRRARRPRNWFTSRRRRSGSADELLLDTLHSDVPIKVHQPHAMAVPAGATLVAADRNGIREVPVTAVEADPLAGVQRGLTKAERKALKRRLNEMRE